MDLEWKQMIESHVYEYISSVDYSNPDFSLNEFKSELKKIVGIIPAVKIDWNTIETINELKKSSGAKDFKTIVDKAQQIDITFVDVDNNPINLKYIL